MNKDSSFLSEEERHKLDLLSQAISNGIPIPLPKESERVVGYMTPHNPGQPRPSYSSVQSNAPRFSMETFELDDIDDIIIQKITPDGYLKTIISTKYGAINNFYGKDKLLIRQQMNTCDNAIMVHLMFDTRPELFDMAFVTWYQNKIINLSNTNVELINQKDKYLNIIQEQANKLLELTLPRED